MFEEKTREKVYTPRVVPGIIEDQHLTEKIIIIPSLFKAN